MNYEELKNKTIESIIKGAITEKLRAITALEQAKKAEGIYEKIIGFPNGPNFKLISTLSFRGLLRYRGELFIHAEAIRKNTETVLSGMKELNKAFKMDNMYNKSRKEVEADSLCVEIMSLPKEDLERHIHDNFHDSISYSDRELLLSLID